MAKTKQSNDLKKCKHCKQTDHLRISSHLCPKNSNYNASSIYFLRIQINAFLFYFEVF